MPRSGFKLRDGKIGENNRRSKIITVIQKEKKGGAEESVAQ